MSQLVTATPRLPRMALLAVSASLLLGCLAAPAFADHRHDDHWHGRRVYHDWHHHWHGGYYDGGYYPPPPVVYGAPYYAPPPVVYTPGFGVNIHIP